MKKDFLSVYDLTRRDFDRIFGHAATLKAMLKDGIIYQPLAGKTLGMIFDKSSTRTRLSFEAGMYQLGGLAIYLNSRDTQLGRGETIADTARIVSRYLDAVMIRTFAQESVEEFARHATIPIINGLTDLMHPCQIVSDLFTIVERKGTYAGLKIAYVGDGNNMANSWIDAAARLPFKLTLACPRGYRPGRPDSGEGQEEGPERDLALRDPVRAVKDADVVYTDVWASMGQEAEQEARAKVFEGYQVNRKLMRQAQSPMPSSCTACPRIAARRSPRRSSTGRSPWSSMRRRTGCTCRRRYSRF